MRTYAEGERNPRVSLADDEHRLVFAADLADRVDAALDGWVQRSLVAAGAGGVAVTDDVADVIDATRAEVMPVLRRVLVPMSTLVRAIRSLRCGLASGR